MDKNRKSANNAMPPNTAAPSGRQIQSVQRAINILNCFSATNTALSLGQISARLNLNRGTVHGILTTLYNNGYVSQNSAGQYMLGAELFNKAHLAPDTRRSMYIDMAHDKMQALSNQFQANGTLFAADNGHLLMLDATEPTNSIFVVRRTASHISLYGSASGKLLLAYMPEKQQQEYLSSGSFPAFTPHTKTTRQKLEEEFVLIREQGYAYEDNELFMGVSALAVPIFTQYGDQFFGTMSLTGMSVAISRHKKEIYKSLSNMVQKLQQSIQF